MVIAIASLLGLLATASSASAAAVYRYEVSIDNGAYNAVVGGSASVRLLNSALTYKIVVRPPAGVEKYSITRPAGDSSWSTGSIAGLAPGDLIDVYQPSGAVTPTETYTIPPVSLNVVNGATSLTGNVPPGLAVAILNSDYRCTLNRQPIKLGPGPFSVQYPTILPGESVFIYAISPTNDTLGYTVNSPGETPCVTVDASGKPATPPGSGPGENPYNLYVGHMLTYIAPSVRAVLRRGAAVLADVSADNTSANTSFTTKPLPGDVVDIYRPKTAPSPSYSIVVPQVSARFDPAAELVAVDGPASGIQQVTVCRQYSCGLESLRAIIGSAAGRTFFDYAAPQGNFAPFDLRPTDIVNVNFSDSDFKLSFRTQAEPGDLVAPIQSFKLASKLKRKSLLKAFKKGFKVNLKSNEPATAKLTLTLPPATTKSKKKSKKKPKTVTLATATKPTVAGNTTVYLKFTKAGKSAIKKLSKKATRSAVLTSTVTDASGNASTVVKKTKIKP
jgi:hypothetical protein